MKMRGCQSANHHVHNEVGDRRPARADPRHLRTYWQIKLKHLERGKRRRAALFSDDNVEKVNPLPEEYEYPTATATISSHAPGIFRANKYFLQVHSAGTAQVHGGT